MKHIIILGDGMADHKIAALGNKTPLQAADTPAMDWLARHGRLGMVNTVPEGMPPGSEVANMAVLGYDVARLYQGRGVLEAASMGIDVPQGTLAMRCNLITIDGDRIKNHSAGHITTAEATELIAALAPEFAKIPGVAIHPGVSYRHLLMIDGADSRVRLVGPHNVPGRPVAENMPTALVPEAQPTADLITRLIETSQRILRDHPVNQRRVAAGLDPANSIWPWSPGYRPAMQPLGDKYDIRNGAVISAVDLIFGIGVYAGLRPIHVPGATGLYDTNYEGKAQAAIEALRGGADFVFLHVEASDEAGHEGDYALKQRTIENLDHRIVRPILEAAKTLDEPLAIALLPDHPTPCEVRTHTAEAVPFVIYKPGTEADAVDRYDEDSAAEGAYGTIDAQQFMPLFFE